MSRLFAIHPDNPQARLLRQAVSLIDNGGLVVYPTDSGYAIGCRLGDGVALQRIRRLRQLKADHNFTMVARDLSDLATFATVSNTVSRLLRAFTPGPYTFILQATKEVPKRMLHPRRRTLGFRIPDNPIALSLLEYLETPLVSTTLILPEAESPLCEPEAIHDLLGARVDLVINGGHCSHQPTTIVDLTRAVPEVLRHGSGDVSPFLGEG